MTNLQPDLKDFINLSFEIFFYIKNLVTYICFVLREYNIKKTQTQETFETDILFLSSQVSRI